MEYTCVGEKVGVHCPVERCLAGVSSRAEAVFFLPFSVGRIDHYPEWIALGM